MLDEARNILDVVRKDDWNKALEIAQNFEKTFEKDPGTLDFDTLRVFGGTFARHQDYGKAIKFLEPAVKMAWPDKVHHPVVAETVRNYANALYYDNKYQRALDYFSWMAQEAPEDDFLQNRAGRVWNVSGNDAKAIEFFEKAIAAARRRLKREESEDKKEELWKNYYRYRCNRSLIMLRMGKWLRSWNEFRLRFKAYNMEQVKLDQEVSVWTGVEPIEQQTIILLPEQGIGDNIMTIRYAHLLREMGAKIVYFADERLFKLYNYSGLFDKVYRFGDKMASPGFKVSLFDLPCLFKTTPDTVPQVCPYLRAEPGRLESLIGKFDGKLKVGIVWGGNPDFPNDWIRSVPLESWGPIFGARNDVQFFSIQKGPREAELKTSQFQDRVIDLTPFIDDFYDTACFMMDLDLILTCDTSVGHVGGGLCRPTWIFTCFSPDWRWLRDRSDTPWYPTVRLFRQESYLDWTVPIANVAEALKHFEVETDFSDKPYDPARAVLKEKPVPQDFVSGEQTLTLGSSKQYTIIQDGRGGGSAAAGAIPNLVVSAPNMRVLTQREPEDSDVWSADSGTFVPTRQPHGAGDTGAGDTKTDANTKAGAGLLGTSVGPSVASGSSPGRGSQAVRASAPQPRKNVKIKPPQWSGRGGKKGPGPKK